VSDERPGRTWAQHLRQARFKAPIRSDGPITLGAIVLVMWLVEVANALDGYRLDRDGIYARNITRFWGILSSPFIHASFQHLFDNTIPFVVLGLIIALQGARRLLIVTGFIAVIGGLGTWLIGPGNASTIGASGIVFGYATYLMARGFFDRRLGEIAIGMLVALVWGAVLLASLVPHTGISWQDHLCGAVAGLIVAWRLARSDQRQRVETPATGTQAA
jgi:membrane associated rhomboid family serine protease